MILRAWVRRIIDRDLLSGCPVPSRAPGPWRLAYECDTDLNPDPREALARHCAQSHPGWELVILPAGQPPVIPSGKAG